MKLRGKNDLTMTAIKYSYFADCLDILTKEYLSISRVVLSSLKKTYSIVAV